ncbi:hypothetical protein F4781DRAFT_412628 [Annulohypoxylon bovei var. microspora]|nr:hypothetical protein F4781DRAFT_412628 [Annulohypoxylon bovei var. microspora]
MSLHRWSLPSRAFNREKSNHSDSSQRGKFPTIHIGDPGARRRANLSIAFASLFDKDENRLNSILPSDGNNIRELLPLSDRIENIPSPSKLKEEKHDSGVHHSDTPIYPAYRGRLAGLFSKQDKELKESHSAILLNECSPKIRSSRTYTLGTIKSPTPITSVRSASSSYPSEGIRSPPEHCVSPQLNIWSESFMSEISHYGTYPSLESSRRSTVSTNGISAPIDRGGQCLMEELAAVGGISDTETRTTSRDYTTKPPLSDTMTVGSPKEQQDNSSDTCHDSDSTIMRMQEVQGLPFSRGDGIHLLDGQVSSTSAVYGSFLELESSTHTGSSEEEFPFRPSNTGSADRLRQSTETHGTRPTKVHWKTHYNRSNTMPASISQKNPLRDHLAIATTHFESQQLPGIHFKGSNESSTNPVQQIHKFKFRKWIKRVCLRTKVRFDSAIRIEASSPKALSKKKSQSQKIQRAKRGNGAYKVKSKSKKLYWKHLKAMKRFAKKVREQEGRRHRFIRTLHKKHSIQLPIREKPNPGHRRVQSCPA